MRNKIVLETTDTLTAKSDVNNSLDVTHNYGNNLMAFTKVVGSGIKDDTNAIGVLTCDEGNY